MTTLAICISHDDDHEGRSKVTVTRMRLASDGAITIHDHVALKARSVDLGVGRAVPRVRSAVAPK